MARRPASRATGKDKEKSPATVPSPGALDDTLAPDGKPSTGDARGMATPAIAGKQPPYGLRAERSITPSHQPGKRCSDAPSAAVSKYAHANGSRGF